MTLHRYFKRTLPTPEDTGLSERATKEANQTVSSVLGQQESTESTASRKRSYLVFSNEQRATIGWYAATTGNTAALKKFNGNLEAGWVRTQ